MSIPTILKEHAELEHTRPKKNASIEETILFEERMRVSIAEIFDEFENSLSTPQKAMWTILRNKGGLTFPPGSE